MEGWQVITLVVCGIAVVAAFFVLKFMPPQHMAKAGEEEIGIVPLQRGFEVSPGFESPIGPRDSGLD